MTQTSPDTPLLSVQDLSIAFRRDGAQALAVRNVSFDIRKGETLALVGESGSGKSITALSVLKLLPYPSASHPTGKILFEGRDLLCAPQNELRGVRGNRITMVFQEPMSSLNPLHTIEKQVGEMLILHRGMSVSAARKRTLELLHEVGIPNPEERLSSYPHQLSGGQRQRVMIAMALANSPDLLIADEPTTALDVTVQAQILKLLKELQARLGMAMLFITHDLNIVRKIADRVCVMQKGEIVEQGGAEETFSNPQHPYTQALLKAEPRPDPAPASEGEVVMEAQDVKVYFPIKKGFFRKTVGHVKAVDGVNLSIRRGETLGVVGESGSGKTTLGLALLRLISSKSGPVAFLGQRIDGLGFKAMRPLRRQMQMVFQDPYGALSPRMSVSEIIGEGLLVHERTLSADAREQRVIDALRDVGLDPEARHRYPHEFSGGQRQRISIARAMALEPAFVVLDEPTSALDMIVQAQIVDLLRALQRKRDLAFMFITHDLRVVSALASHILVMRGGQAVEYGLARDVFETPKEDYTRALFSAAFSLETAESGVVRQ